MLDFRCIAWVRQLLAGAVITAFFIAALTTSAHAGPIIGEYWDVAGQTGNPPDTGFPSLDPTGGSYLATVDSVIASRSADATFQTSGIDYTGDSSTSQTLANFLGADAATLSPDLGNRTVLGTIFRFTGELDLLAGINNFEIFSDDGFRLSIGGALVNEFDALRAPSSSFFSYDAGLGGIASFELIYFEAQQVLAAVTARLNGNVITPVRVPEPTILALLGIGLAGLGLSRRKKLRKV